MAAIRGKDTKPEITLRSLLHSAGYRYQLHRKDLPGRPDLVFSGRKKIIFVHGCFWHWHGCRNSVLPKTRQEWWLAKLQGNADRDARVIWELEQAGWQTLVVWECDIRSDAAAAAATAAKFLEK
jgi:DNA mismatch endonuclease (patch repair protein)